MQVNSVNPSPNFQAVNQKYVQRAQSEYRMVKNISNHLRFCIKAETFSFKTMSIQDAIDTLEAIKKFAIQSEATLSEDINNFKNLLRKRS